MNSRREVIPIPGSNEPTGEEIRNLQISQKPRSSKGKSILLTGFALAASSLYGEQPKPVDKPAKIEVAEQATEKVNKPPTIAELQKIWKSRREQPSKPPVFYPDRLRPKNPQEKTGQAPTGKPEKK